MIKIPSSQLHLMKPATCLMGYSGPLKRSAKWCRRTVVVSLYAQKILPKDREFSVIDCRRRSFLNFSRSLSPFEIKDNSEEKILISVTENQIAFKQRKAIILSRLVSGAHFPTTTRLFRRKRNYTYSFNKRPTRRNQACLIMCRGPWRFS